jgi:hypothetical protein
MASIYGHFPTQQENEYSWKRIYAYLEAKIKAEKLNPEDDYEGTRENELLKEIAKADLPYIMRHMLINLIESENKNSDE